MRALLLVGVLLVGCSSAPKGPSYSEQMNMILADPNMSWQEKDVRIKVLIAEQQREAIEDQTSAIRHSAALRYHVETTR